MWEMRLQIQVVLHRAKAETDTFMARPKRELLLPVRSESDVYYVDLALLFLVPVLPIMCFIISIPLKWKTDVAVMEG